MHAYLASSVALVEIAAADGVSPLTLRAALHFANLAPCLHLELEINMNDKHASYAAQRKL